MAKWMGHQTEPFYSQECLKSKFKTNPKIHSVKVLRKITAQ